VIVFNLVNTDNIIYQMSDRLECTEYIKDQLKILSKILHASFLHSKNLTIIQYSSKLAKIPARIDQ